MEKADENLQFEFWEYPAIQPEAPSNELTPENSFSQQPDLHDVSEVDTPPDLNQQENELIQKIELINQIACEFKSLYQTICSELLTDGVSLIHKITQKVIHKQLEQDPDILQKQIEEATQLIHSKKTQCTLFVSCDDYESLKEYIERMQDITVKTDVELSKGSFRLKTAENELEFDIEKRLNNLFEL